MVDIKFSLDNSSGNILNFTVCLGDNPKPEELAMALEQIKTTFGSKASNPPQPVMAKDVRDLAADKLTIMERLKLFLKFEYRSAWFGSIVVKERYEQMYGEELKISTVSTYLSRLHKEGFLERRGNKVEREYRIVEIEEPAAVLEPRVQTQLR